MVQLTPLQKEELNKIMSDKYARGPFSGMIYNALTSRGDVLQQDIDNALILALNVKIRLEELANKEE